MLLKHHVLDVLFLFHGPNSSFLRTIYTVLILNGYSVNGIAQNRIWDQYIIQSRSVTVHIVNPGVPLKRDNNTLWYILMRLFKKKAFTHKLLALINNIVSIKLWWLMQFTKCCAVIFLATACSDFWVINFFNFFFIECTLYSIYTYLP